MPRNSEVFLQDIISCIDKILGFVPDTGYASFIEDEKTLLAVTRLLEIMGEAAAKVAPDIQDRHPDLPWKNLRDLRNHVVHHYWDIDTTILWDVVENELRPLRQRLAEILQEVRQA
jgi:uncharacterized protein with HEPN domain